MNITCMGEMLVDMIQEDNNKILKAHPGGAPANVAVGIARLGGRPIFVGKVGKDAFGDTLEDILLREKVNTMGLKKSGHTVLAFVSLDDNGERSIEFKGNLTSFSIEDIEFNALDGTKIFHFGSISLIKNPSRIATVHCLDYVKARNITISYDPNLRLSLWPNEECALEGIKEGLGYANVLKVSKEELEFITSEKNINKGITKLTNEYPKLLIIAVTLGEAGTICWYKDKIKEFPTIRVDVIDTTGAGDGFMAGLLYRLSGVKDINNIDWDELENIINFANVTGSLVTTKKGAIPALPTIDEVTEVLSEM